MAGSPIDFIRYATDLALGAPDAINLRRFTASIVKISWSGGRPGAGNKTVTTTTLTNANSVPVKVARVNSKDIALSGGKLTDRDFVIGPLVFPYDTGSITGGTNISSFAPNTANDEMYIKIEGDGLQSGGSMFKKAYDVADKNVVYRIYVTGTATKNA